MRCFPIMMRKKKMNEKILVIDDSPFVFKMIKKAIEPQGYIIVGNASNGKKGLEMIKELNPDVVTLDITMPIMDGIETAKIIKQKFPNLKVIMLSAMGDNDLVEELKNIGVDTFVTKPFKPPIILDALETVLT